MCLWDNDYLTRTRVEKKSCLNIKHLLTLSISNPRYLLLLKEQLHRLSSRGLEYAKKGNVRKIHTGFSGPGTGENYKEFVAEFEKLINDLLKES